METLSLDNNKRDFSSALSSDHVKHDSVFTANAVPEVVDYSHFATDDSNPPPVSKKKPRKSSSAKSSVVTPTKPVPSTVVNLTNHSESVPLTTNQVLEGGESLDRPCSNPVCLKKIQDLQDEVNRLKRTITMSPSMATTYSTGTLPVTPGPSSASLTAPVPIQAPVPPPVKTPAELAQAVSEGRVSSKRDMIRRGISKQMVWKDSCKRGSARWMWEGDCTFPELVRILKLPLNTKPFCMKRIPIEDFEAAIGSMNGKARYDVLSLTGANVIVHFGCDTVKITGSYGKSGIKRFPW